MTAPFLALITPIGETVTPPQPPLGIWGPTDPRPGTGFPGPQPQPPGIWGPNDPRPSNPIAGMGPGGNFPGQPPLGIWGPTDPRPGTGFPGPQPMPTPPIYIPPEGSPPPLGIWGPTDPRPGWGLPGNSPVPAIPSCYRRTSRRRSRLRASCRRHRLTGRWRGRPRPAGW